MDWNANAIDEEVDDDQPPRMIMNMHSNISNDKSKENVPTNAKEQPLRSMRLHLLSLPTTGTKISFMKHLMKQKN